MNTLKKILYIQSAILFLLYFGCLPKAVLVSSTGKIINHLCTKLNSIPESAIQKAKSSLHIVYGHTSHGSQLTTGMTGLAAWKGSLYSYNNGGTGGALDLREDVFGMVWDLGNPDFTSWETATRTYLNTHPEVNTVIWAWCGQLSWVSEDDVNQYLSLMNGLETSYPNVQFVYMTGHTDGTGLSGTLHQNNERIRNYCSTNNKYLYDFEDIESYDPDGNYFGDRNVADDCSYSNGAGGYGNWAVEWQNAHTQNADWFACDSAHSEPLNANLKAYAAWWLWATLAGW